MLKEFPDSMPNVHRQFLQNIVQNLSADSRIVGITASGSYLTNTMDEYSDLDVELAIESQDYSTVMTERQKIAASVGSLLSGFTGEHVGEPSILICLYENPLIHVDYNFVDIKEISKGVNIPVVLWERDNRISSALKNMKFKVPSLDLQWIEDRFWVWIHFIAVKIGRGELFVAVDSFSFLRDTVFGPMILMNSGSRPISVRRLETLAQKELAFLAQILTILFFMYLNLEEFVVRIRL